MVAAAQSARLDPRVAFGIGLVVVAVVLIALGSNLQRYALTRIDPARRVFSTIVERDLIWAFGLVVYFTANVLYTIALAFTPASVCATLIADVVIVNAGTSRCLLQERLQPVDVQGSALISVGIVLAAAYAPYETASYSAAQCTTLFTAPTALALLGLLGLVLFVLAATVLRHEADLERRRRLRAKGIAVSKEDVLFQRRAAAMPFAYPLVTGLLESLVQLMQKGGSSMIALTMGGDSQLRQPAFAAVLAAWAASSLAAVWWMRKGLENLPAHRMLPVEYGAFVSSSVVVGLVVYDEARYVDAAATWCIALGVALVVAGCGLIGSRRVLDWPGWRAPPAMQ